MPRGKHRYMLIGGGHCRIETSHSNTLMTRMKGSKAPLPFVLSEHVYYSHGVLCIVLWGALGAILQANAYREG
jgi:hypothetical protein